jgi:small-conductance mechanosensitive channel
MEKVIKEWLFDPTISKIIFALIAILIIRAIVAGFHRTLGHIKESQSRYRLRKLINIIGYLTAILFLAVIFKDRLGGVAGWVAVVFGNFYDTGDRVQLGGIKGDVIDIGMLRTTLMEIGEWVKADQYTGRIVRIANSFVFKEPVFNYTADFPFLWDEIPVPIMYGSDYERARTIMVQCAQEVVGEYITSAREKWRAVTKRFVLEDTIIEPSANLIFHDNWIEIALRYVVDAKRRRVTKNRIFMRILEEINKTPGQVRIASTTMQLVSPHAFDVRMTGANQGLDAARGT